MRLDHRSHVEVCRHEHVVDCTSAFLLVDSAKVQAGGKLVFHFAKVADEHAFACEVVEGVQERVATRAPHEATLRVVHDRNLGFVSKRLIEGSKDLREPILR